MMPCNYTLAPFSMSESVCDRPKGLFLISSPMPIAANDFCEMENFNTQIKFNHQFGATEECRWRQAVLLCRIVTEVSLFDAFDSC